MKRFAICALAVLMMGGVATAQDAKLWIQAPDGSNAVTVSTAGTAVIELWMEVYSMPYNGRLVAVDSILSHYGGSFDVQGFTDYGPWGTFGRLDPRGLITVPGGDLNQYQFVGVDQNKPFSAASGLGAGVYHLDDIIIAGVTETAVDDTVLFSFTAPPGGFKIYPGYTAYYDLSVGFGTGNNGKGTASDLPLFVTVTPEPTALSLLLLGGLAVFRRR